MSDIIYIENDNLIALQGLQKAQDQSYLNAATVELTVEDDAGSPVSGQTWPVAMGYVAGSNGDYEAVLDAGAGLEKNKRYFAVITADGGPGLQAKWRSPLRAKVRG